MSKEWVLCIGRIYVVLDAVIDYMRGLARTVLLARSTSSQHRSACFPNIQNHLQEHEERQDIVAAGHILNTVEDSPVDMLSYGRCNIGFVERSVLQSKSYY